MIKMHRTFNSGNPLRKKLVIVAILLSTVLFAEEVFAGTESVEQNSERDYNYSISTTWHSFMNFEPEDTNIGMYEFHFGYRLTDKDKIEIKIATWKLFEPMGIQLWDPHLMKESEYYPGRLLEYGVGLCYRRTLWKGLFAAVEILPLKQEYLDVNGEKIMDGFRLYTSYHLGYHFPFFNNRVYVEPQIHCNYWPIMTDGPEEFEVFENREWSKNYILFEPNIYIGVNF
jgi:hypothetical protein